MIKLIQYRIIIIAFSTVIIKHGLTPAKKTFFLFLKHYFFFFTWPSAVVNTIFGLALLKHGIMQYRNNDIIHGMHDIHYGGDAGA